MCPEGCLSENSRPLICCESHTPCSHGSGPLVLALSSDSPGAEGHVFGAGAGPGGAGSQEKLMDESLCSHPDRQLKGNRTPLPQPKWQLPKSSCLLEFDH